jgi:hypothetical protein
MQSRVERLDTSLCLMNEVPHREAVGGEDQSGPRHLMKMSARSTRLPFCPGGKCPRIGEGRYGRCGALTNLSLPGNEPQPSSPHAVAT